MLDQTQETLCDENTTDFSDLKALTINCTLKSSPEGSHTDKLLGVTEAILVRNDVALEQVRLVDHTIAPGVYPDMTEHGAAQDDWPAIWDKVAAADILVIGTPIWLGEESSVCRRLIERLYGESGKTNAQGQTIYYGRTAGCVITGNEDGAKHCAMTLLYAAQHLGFVVPPQADAAWVGEAGPGKSYGDDADAGPSNDFTQRNITFMSWNLMHMARMLRDAGGLPAHGNQPEAWSEGERFGHPGAAS